MSVHNARRAKNRLGKRQAKDLDIPVSHHPRDEKCKHFTRHARVRARERMPLTSLPFTPKSLNKLIQRGKAIVKKSREYNEREIFFSDIQEDGSGNKIRLHYKVVVTIVGGKVSKIITVWCSEEQPLVENESIALPVLPKFSFRDGARIIQ